MKKHFLIVLAIIGFLQSVKSQCPSGTLAFLNADPTCSKGCGVLLYNWPEGVTVYIFRAHPIKIVDSAIIPGTYGGSGTGSSYLCVSCNISLIFASTVPNATNGCVIISGFTTPIKLTDFALFASNSASCLMKWTTYSENPSTTFTIQRSNNSIDFIDIATINGYGKASNNYSYTDNSIENQRQYYKIKITEISGKITYSEITLLKSQLNLKVSIYPNPATDNFKISIPNQYLPAIVTLYNAEGKVVYSLSTLQSTTAVTNRFSKGVYTIRITANNNTTVTQKLLIK